MEFNDIPKVRKSKKPINPHPITRGRRISDVETGKQILQQQLKRGSASVGGNVGSGHKIGLLNKQLSDREAKLSGNNDSERTASAVGVYSYTKDIASNKLRQKLNTVKHSVLNKSDSHTSTPQQKSVASQNAQKSNPPPVAPTQPTAPKPATPPVAPTQPTAPKPPKINTFKTPKVKKIKPFSQYYKK